MQDFSSQQEVVNALADKYFVLINDDYQKKIISAGYVENVLEANDLYCYCEMFNVEELPEDNYELDTAYHQLLSGYTFSERAFFFEDYSKMYQFLVKKAEEVKTYNDNQEKDSDS